MAVIRKHPKYRYLCSNDRFGIKKTNPYNGNVYEVVVPEPGMQIHPNAVIIIEDGKQRMISKGGLAARLWAGGGFVNDPALRL